MPCKSRAATHVAAATLTPVSAVGFSSAVQAQDCPAAGARYQRQSETVFRPLNAAGKTGTIICRLNRSKTLTGRW